MATRTDVIVLQRLPRVVELRAPATEFPAQDVIDTLRALEDEFENMGFDRLIDAAGKSVLGPGLQTGITNTLFNAQIAFEPRFSPAETGSVTTPSGSVFGTPPRYTFSDSAADFIAAGVQRGSFIINFDDGSVSDVFEVVDGQTLETRVLQNGVTNTWGLGDAYQIFNITQCRLGGGNTVATDENTDPISQILPTAFTQVIIELDTSAALAESDAEANAAAVWNSLTADFQAPGTFGEYVRKKLLSVVSFLGLK